MAVTAVGKELESDARYLALLRIAAEFRVALSNILVVKTLKSTRGYVPVVIAGYPQPITKRRIQFHS
jgi:hypothetical protein